MVYNFNEEINEESTQRFLNFINSIPPLGDTEDGKTVKEPLTMYINSVGGNYDLATVLIDVLDNYEGDVLLVGYGSLSSCAFDLFFTTKVRKRLIPGTVGMYHMASVSITINEKGKPHSTADSNVVYRIKNISEVRTKILMKLLKMSSSEQKTILRGDDLHISSDRMFEFLKHVT